MGRGGRIACHRPRCPRARALRAMNSSLSLGQLPVGSADTATSISAAERPAGPTRARDVATSHFDDLLQRYEATGESVPVSFRSLVGPLPAADLTHAVHPYPARLLRQVPRFFLNC